MFSIKYVFPIKSLTANNDPLNISKIIPNVSDKVFFFFSNQSKTLKNPVLVCVVS